MERLETVEIGRRLDGTKIIRNRFINDSINHLVKAQSYFTKDAKKLAKLRHRIELRKQNGL